MIGRPGWISGCCGGSGAGMKGGRRAGEGRRGAVLSGVSTDQSSITQYVQSGLG